MLGGGQGLDEGPEVLEGDALAIADAHLTQDITEALVCSQALWTQGHERGTRSPISRCSNTAALPEFKVHLGGSEGVLQSTSLLLATGTLDASTPVTSTFPGANYLGQVGQVRRQETFELVPFQRASVVGRG